MLFQYEKTNKFISTAKNEGATILYGGQRPTVMDHLLGLSTLCRYFLTG